jgi:FPC/CPF motif-containing protein YcgG
VLVAPVPAPQDTGEVLASEEDVLACAPVWGRDAYRAFAATMQSCAPAFPCTFAVAAFRRGQLRYTFAESALDKRSLLGVRDALIEFMGTYREIGRHTSLVVMFRPEGERHSISEYRRRFWGLLRFLHEHDPQPWPERVPRSPDDPLWQFCFDGEDIFVVCNTPAHRLRRSRYSGCMTVLFQPMWTFEALLTDPDRMLEACRPIRARLMRYDGIDRHPALGMLGESDNREWRHYFLPDTNHERYGRCPF